MNTLLYCIRQGIRNFIRNPLFSFASVATVSACIFLFGIFLIMAQNLQSILLQAETNVGITVFFTEDASGEDKDRIREAIEGYGGVSEIRYISAEDAWKEFSTSYFGEESDEIREAFGGENPLASSDSFEVFMNDINDQNGIAEMLRDTPHVREVNYASNAVSMLRKLNDALKWLSLIIIGILFAVSVFLISNTINVSAVFRKRENEIMKMIGAKDFMIRSPFVAEGLLIGLTGALIPLLAINAIYTRFTAWFEEQIGNLAAGSALREVIVLVPLEEMKPLLLLSGLVLGIAMGYFVSLFTINRHLRAMR